VLGKSLRYGSSTSCGCFARDFQRERIRKDPVWQQNTWKPTTGATRYVVEKDGKSQTLAEWSKETGISLPVLVNRWARGWPDHLILEPTQNQYNEMFENPEPQFDINKKPKEREV
jgi:hypothetical protein